MLLDDFGLEHHVLGHHLKRWADHYPFKVEIKGLTSNARPVRIVVTSNYHPKDIWGEKPQDLEAIVRRFNIIYKGPPIEPPPILNFK